VGRSLWREKGLSFTIAAGLASAVILGSKSRGTRDHILLSKSNLPFSSPPTTRRATVRVFGPVSTRAFSLSRIKSSNWTPFFITTFHGPNTKHRSQQYSYCCVFTNPLLRNGVFYCCVRVHFRGNLFIKPSRSNELFRLSGVISQHKSCPHSLQLIYSFFPLCSFSYSFFNYFVLLLSASFRCKSDSRDLLCKKRVFVSRFHTAVLFSRWNGSSFLLAHF
jgi:hypothetical protein